MTNTPPDPVLADAHAQVAASYEIVPWLEQLYLPSELMFSPLPADMLALVEASGDFTMPEPGKPVLVKIFSENGEAGMMIFVRPVTSVLYVLVPVRSHQ